MPAIVEDNKLAATSPIALDRLEALCTDACASTLGTDAFDYNKRTDATSQIIETIIAKLTEENSGFKYIVSVTVVQSTVTGPIQMSTGAFWNSEKDGMWKTKWSSATVDAIISIAWIQSS